ncbi:MAG: M14 family metallopeptidase [Gemmatimonadota bacterium]|nr:MAG: M14 family metallopeptidase [Gemmatimonadota bacterium]
MKDWSSRSRYVVLYIAIAAGMSDNLFAQQPLTVAEASGFTATSRHSDIVDFITELQRQSSLINIEILGVSGEGREIPLMVIGDPVPTSPADLKYDDRAVVYFQANIHAGEVEGKEAAQMLARDLIQGKTAAYLNELVILIAPIFNPDGNEKISTENRRNQVGPEQGVGIRYNGQNLDLNRDGMKVETPEVRGLIQNVLQRWDPLFFLDSHTHNGSYHQEPVTWTWGLNPNGDPRILDHMERVLLPYVTERMREVYGTLTIPHGDFVDVTEPETGWVPLGPQPRYLSNYVGLRNRISILNEQYPYVDFETRVQGAYNLFLTFLDFLHTNKDEVVALVRQADRRAVARGLSPSEDDVFIVEYEEGQPIDQALTIQGYEMELVEGFGGRRRARPTDVKRTYSDVPYLARFTAKRTVSFPTGYLITVPDERVLETLLAHGIAVEKLTEAATLSVESFRVTSVSGSSRLNQGHYTSSVVGEYTIVDKEFPVGTLFVSTAQALGSVAAYLLEPESDDGLVVWNFFDRYLQAQWADAAQMYPVFRLLTPTNLVTVPVAH